MPVSTRTSPGSPPAAAEKSKRSVTTRGHWGATSGREHVDSASSFERYELAEPFLCEGDDEQERLVCSVPLPYGASCLFVQTLDDLGSGPGLGAKMNPWAGCYITALSKSCSSSSNIMSYTLLILHIPPHLKPNKQPR
jgi:hypothetical protein